ncbi:RodZ domain-containing protein [Haemophilus sputorum]
MTESLNTTSELSLGQQLKQAREALGLSVEDVAKKTNLKKSHIESLENDIFVLQNVAPTFVRGYVRNYVRFLRLPEGLVSSVNYGEVILPKTVMNNAQPSKVKQKSQTQWVKYLTIAILLGALGMTLVWWYQDYQKEQANRDQFVIAANQETQQQTNNAAPAKNEIALPALQTENKTVETAAQPAVEPVKTETPVVEQPVVTAPTETTAQTESEKQSIQAVENAEPTANAESAVNVLQQNNATTEQPVAEEQAPQQALPIDALLRIEVTGKESWITVKGASSKKSLAEKLYTSGEVLTFNENEQYRLTIGAPANVKIYYKGEEVPLKIDGRVARIKLPLQ